MIPSASKSWGNINVDTYYGNPLTPIGNRSCFAGASVALGKEIYIKNFRRPETEKYIEKLVETLNKITPTKLVKISNVEYIKLQMFDDYNKSLLMLNFVRNLWWQQNGFNKELFFTHLVNSTYKDPLKRLTAANIKGCESPLMNNHSNCHPKEKLKVKSLEDLKAFDFKQLFLAKIGTPNMTGLFLTS